MIAQNSAWVAHHPFLVERLSVGDSRNGHLVPLRLRRCGGLNSVRIGSTEFICTTEERTDRLSSQGVQVGMQRPPDWAPIMVGRSRSLRFEDKRPLSFNVILLMHRRLKEARTVYLFWCCTLAGVSTVMEQYRGNDIFINRGIWVDLSSTFTKGRFMHTFNCLFWYIQNLYESTRTGYMRWYTSQLSLDIVLLYVKISKQKF